MKYKKSIIILSFFILAAISLTSPRRVIADPLEFDLPAGNFVTVSGSMTTNDYLNWSFTSTLSEIMVMMLSNYEYNNYIDYDILSYTALLNDNDFSDSGWWRPPQNDVWHLIFENVGDVTTHLVIVAEVDNNYFSREILFNDLVTGYIGFFMVIIIGSISLALQRSKLKRV